MQIWGEKINFVRLCPSLLPLIQELLCAPWPMVKRDNKKYALDLESVTIRVSDYMELRFSRKIMPSGFETADLRVWQLGNNGKFFPRRNAGLNLKIENWPYALKLLDENRATILRPSNDKIEGQ